MTRWRACASSSTPRSSVSRWRRSEEHTSELQSQSNLVCRLLLEKKKTNNDRMIRHDAAAQTALDEPLETQVAGDRWEPEVTDPLSPREVSWCTPTRLAQATGPGI